MIGPSTRLSPRPFAVAIDTVFRSFGGGNVNDSSHMNAYIEALKGLIGARDDWIWTLP